MTNNSNSDGNNTLNFTCVDSMINCSTRDSHIRKKKKESYNLG